MTKTYSEQRQAAYFAAARELYRVAARVLDDSYTDAELTGRTHEWVQNQSRITCEQARALEDRGHEETVASPRAENALYRAKREHSDAVTRYLDKRNAALARAERLEYLRAELRAERISYAELAELQDLAEHIPADDLELLEAAGVPERS